MRKKRKIGLIIGVIATVILLVIGVSLITRVSKLETTKTVGNTLLDYTVGKLDDSTGKAMTTAARDEFEDDGGLYEGYMSVKQFVNADGLKCKLAEKATIEYKVYYFDDHYHLLGATNWLSVDYTAADNVTSATAAAKYAKVEITPTSDADGVISTTEISKYAKMLTVTYNKFDE